MAFGTSSYGKKEKVEESAGGTWVADRRLCLTEDKSRVVEEDTPEARWLWAIPGQTVDREEAERLGAVKSETTVELPATPPRRKPGRPPAAKAATPAENK